MSRIDSLRALALEPACDKTEFYFLFYKRYAELEGEEEFIRYPKAFEFAFAQLTPNITDGELIVGEISNNLSEEESELWSKVYHPYAVERLKNINFGQDSHMAIDYELLLHRGINGIISMIEDYEASASREQRLFYSAAKACLSAVVLHSEKYASLAEKMAKEESDPHRREELHEIAKVCRRVPANPAESFREALQSVHFVSYCLGLNPLRLCYQQFQLGHPDRYLYPFYKNDVESGVLTREQAQELLDLLGIQINMRVPRGLSCGYMVGGRNEKGETVANELTEMLMQVVDDVRLVYPSVGLCHTSDMPEKYLNKALEILSRGRSHPAIFNDEVITKGLLHYGVSPAEACNYIHSTCVEITPVAASNVWVASPYTNMAELLLETMKGSYADFEEHLEALLALIDERIRRNFEEQNSFRKRRGENSLNPLLSCFVNDCLARGTDIERGGARYNWIMPSFVGMANLVDSLYVLKKTVYEEKRFTLSRMKEIIDANFEGNEALRLHLLNDIPKYGNDIDEVDSYFGYITEHIASECEKYTGTYSGANLIPSVFCWVKHELFGRSTGATPDGRTAGFPLGDGSGACQGREMRGPTASVLSSTKWDHSKFIGGVAVNLKFAKSSLSENYIQIMSAIVKSYLQRGGFELQINVTDKATLEKARQDPDSYKDLVVRIGGYSDYFTRLSPEMQAEVILRTEHVLA